MLELKYLECVLDESGIYVGKCLRKLSYGCYQVPGYCLSVLGCYTTLLMPVLLYGNKIIWRKNYMSRIRAVQIDNFRCLLVVRRMDKVLNVQIRELGGVTNWVDESVL